MPNKGVFVRRGKGGKQKENIPTNTSLKEKGEKGAGQEKEEAGKEKKREETIGERQVLAKQDAADKSEEASSAFQSRLNADATAEVEENRLHTDPTISESRETCGKKGCRVRVSSY